MSWAGPENDPDRYELHELRSSGGEGQLWRGSIRVDGAVLPVAVKIIHTSRLGDIAEWRIRWQRQAELLRSLDHPGLVKVREVFEGPIPHEPGAANTATNTLFLVMNWVEGPSLDEWVTRYPNRDLLESARVLGRLAAAVDYLHSGAVTGNPVLHRDIKPANVIVTDKGAVLVDFGFTRVVSGQMMSVVGTPAYIAPEVLRTGEHTPASDRYSLGATGYYAITGQNPTPDHRDLMIAALTEASGAEGRSDIAEHVLSMMDPNPQLRPTGAVPWAQQFAAAAVSDTTMTVPRITTPPVVVTSPTPGTPEPLITPLSRVSADGGRRPNKKKWMWIGAAALVAVAAAGVAVALANRGDATTQSPPATVASATTSPPQASPTVVSSTVPSSSSSSVQTSTTIAGFSMPKFGGMSLEQAKATLDKNGVAYQVVEVEGPGPYNLIVETSPAAGTAVASGDVVTLTVAKQPSTMPDVTGQLSPAAIATLKSYGIDVTTTEVLGETNADGMVIDQTPKAGDPFAAAVTLTVNHQPAINYLADLGRVDSGNADVGAHQAQLNGVVYTRSVTLSNSSFSTPSAYVEYDLARSYLRLVGTVGPADNINAATTFKIEIYADGTKVFDQTIGLGFTQPIDLDMTNVLRLRLQITDLTNKYANQFVVFADTRILGQPGVVPTTTTG